MIIQQSLVIQCLLVLAGGFGTRLRSVVADRPKPLAPVNGRPFIEYLIESWVAAGQREFIFLLHHQADLVIKYLRGLEYTVLRGCVYSTIIEHTPLDTGGAVAHGVHEAGLERGFLVANADTWLGSGLAAVQGTSWPCLAVLHVPDASRYGRVQFDDSGLVTGFVEKQAASGPGWINAGLYHLHPEQFASWDGTAFSLEQALFPRLVERQALRAVCLDTDFIDIGIPEDYQRFQNWIETGGKKPL